MNAASAIAVNELVDVLEIAAVGTAESALVNTGGCMPPTVHMISRLVASPYVGYVISRPFRGCADAHAAIAGLGALPAAVRARRLVIAWGHADIQFAVDAPGEVSPNAVIVVDADQDGHEVRWHPFDVTPGSETAAGRPTIVPLWGPSRRERDVALPLPISDLLDRWRAGGDPRELRWLHHRMEHDGYTVRWMRSRAGLTSSHASSGTT